MTDQPQLPNIQPEPSPTDDTERAIYRDRLREHLRDPAFRASAKRSSPCLPEHRQE
jgi:hypothetical protein